MIATTQRFFPLIVTVFSGETDLDDVEKSGVSYRAIHAQKRRVAFIVDSRRAVAPSAPVRRALADMTNSFGEQSRKNTLLTAVVMDSTLLIGALTAVKWFIRDTGPLEYMKTAALAYQRILALASGEGLVFPPACADAVAMLDRPGGPGDLAAFDDPMP